MKRQLLNDALNEISDKHIAAAARKRRSRLPWIGAVAAVLAAAILLSSLGGTSAVPTASATGLVAAPTYPEMVRYGESTWWESTHSQHNQPLNYADSASAFFRNSLKTFLTPESDENTVCSPLNIYLALAMLAETTGGQTRQELLHLLGSSSITDLRTQANHLWNGHYWNDGLSTCIPANSLWLDENYEYVEDTVSTLANSYYASTYRGDLGSKEMNAALQGWLNEQTGGLLEKEAGNIELSPNTVLALASTLYYQVQWTQQFWDELNTTDTFHAPQGDTTVTYMNRTDDFGTYFWGESFGAVRLSLEDGSNMWLVLPDEGIDPTQVLQDNALYDVMSQGDEYENRKSVIVNLSLPKFDISAEQDLVEDLMKMGISRVFTAGVADFSPLLSQNDGGYVDRISHAARVAIDEEGVTAAAFTVIDRCGASMPPTEEVDFVLDRPFLFIIESRDDVPLFAGIVNNP